MGVYDSQIETASRLIREKGQAIPISRKTESSTDPVSGTVTPGAPVSGEIAGVVLPASQGTIEAFDNRIEKGKLIDERLRFILAAAKGAPFEPKSGDELTFDGSTWTALGCTPLKPNGEAIIYNIGVIRA